jgi:NADH-quinone oxidoreductase subunit A
MSNYIGILLLIVMGAGLTALILALSTLLGPKKTNPDKELPFETGNLPTPGGAHQRFPVHFYLVAILFVVFDVEIAFLYPWAVVFKKLGLFGLVEMLIFLAILTLGLVFVIKRGVLEWK